MTWRRYRKLGAPLLAAIGATLTVAADILDQPRLPTQEEIAVVGGAWASVILVWRLPNDA